MEPLSRRKGIVLFLLSLLGVTLFFVWSGLSEVNGVSEEGLILSNAFPDLSFTRPVDLQYVNDSTNRLFVVEKPGRIHVFNNTPFADETQIFLDISHLVSEEGNEMGLLGLAFHPQFESNGYFFVDYTASSPRRTVIARYQVDSGNLNQADISSEQVILEILQPYTNHNGGQIVFGPDGYLYIGMGDGGSGGDPLGHGQDRSTLLGSLLRINVDQTDPGLNYSIPDSNPFYGNSIGFAEEIFAYGLRNPWRFSFDSESGQLFVADVGQNEIEEIDIVENGGNYGWNIKEGSQCYASATCNDTGLIDPIWEYTHNIGHSITGGYVYRGAKLTQLLGKYIYGDFVTGRIWSLEQQDGVVVSNVELFDTSLGISSFGVDENKELYILSYSGSIFSMELEEVSTTSTTNVTTSSDMTQTTTTSDTESIPNGMTDSALVSSVVLGVLVLVAIVILFKRR